MTPLLPKLHANGQAILLGRLVQNPRTQNNMTIMAFHCGSAVERTHLQLLTGVNEFNSKSEEEAFTNTERAWSTLNTPT